VNSYRANSEAFTATPRVLRHAGFWIRVFAGLIDLVAVLIPFSVAVSFAAVEMGIWNDFFFNLRAGQPLPERLAQRGPTLVGIGVAVFILVGWLYFAFAESSTWRGTLGKHTLGLYVADEEGNPINCWRATKRFLFGRLLVHVPIIGVYYFLVDCLCIVVLARKRAIHDVLSGCLVLRESSPGFEFVNQPTRDSEGTR
jgi:uncharacterized RDD family membrane protein YckC